MRASHEVALRDLTTSGIPFLIGGALALGRYTGVERATKDLDVFVLPHDAPRVLDFFGSLGRRVDFAFPHWLGKVYFGRAFMDVIFNWRVLLGHIVTFGFVYPDRRGAVPAWIVDDLVQRLSNERAEPDTRICNGTLLSREQYLSDLRQQGYQDARLAPIAYMTPEALEIWNRDIHGQKTR
jgi:hypothetical protein